MRQKSAVGQRSAGRGGSPNRLPRILECGSGLSAAILLPFPNLKLIRKDESAVGGSSYKLKT
jgi:hypothetical protein